MHVLRCHCSKGEAEASHAMSGCSVHACDMTYAAGMLITTLKADGTPANGSTAFCNLWCCCKVQGRLMQCNAAREAAVTALHPVRRHWYMHGVTTIQMFNVKSHLHCREGSSGDKLCKTD